MALSPETPEEVPVRQGPGPSPFGRVETLSFEEFVMLVHDEKTAAAGLVSPRRPELGGLRR
ncbi:MAG: hypothetical protein DMG28_02825 [Acidobacteria bacterium]|nr:MAG: hypothetical protein DMG28_02825 [Acidobacteriota bacterium]